MRQIDDLSRDELIEIVKSIYEMLYGDMNEIGLHVFREGAIMALDRREIIDWLSHEMVTRGLNPGASS